MIYTVLHFDSYRSGYFTNSAFSALALDTMILRIDYGVRTLLP